MDADPGGDVGQAKVGQAKVAQAKVAQVVLAVAAMAEPPLRLILGGEAYAYATQAAGARAESDAAWRHLTVSTDRDDASAAQRDPLGSSRN